MGLCMRKTLGQFTLFFVVRKRLDFSMVLRPKTATGGESPVYLAQDLYVGDMYDQQ